MALISTRRRKSSLVILVLFAFFIILYYARLRSRRSTQHLKTPHVDDFHDRMLVAQIDFWRQFHPILLANAPKCPSPSREEDVPLDIAFTGEDRLRLDLLTMTVQDEEVMLQAHHDFVDQIQKEGPRLAYEPGTRGIVCTAGGKYLPVMVISLRMLRKTGSHLPMEVLLANSGEYEPQICEVIFPSLNARCIILSDVLDAVSGTMEISHYQYKMFSILFSSFEEILLLDSDSFPIHDPEVLFNHEPFVSAGLVLWPDFWYMSESPAYFTISSQESPSLSERAATEAGEILYSKAKHESSILLATYYNMYGPTHYYALLSQGAPGEGDKETYCWAASALGEPHYHVKEPVLAIGQYNTDRKVVEGSAMVQFDPRVDYLNRNPHLLESVEIPKARPFFVHANYPKFNPATIFKDEIEGARGPTKYANGSYRRVWEAQEQLFGFDLERSFWEEIKWTACELENKFNSWRWMGGICAETEEYWKAIFGET